MENSTREINVETITVDTFCRSIGIAPNVMKMDVEGFEPNVIAGARETIISAKPIIIFELWESRWQKLQPMISFLSERYHLIKLLDGSPAIPFYKEEPRSGVDDILCIPFIIPQPRVS